jgi:hypothetical protein
LELFRNPSWKDTVTDDRCEGKFHESRWMGEWWYSCDSQPKQSQFIHWFIFVDNDWWIRVVDSVMTFFTTGRRKSGNVIMAAQVCRTHWFVRSKYRYDLISLWRFEWKRGISKQKNQGLCIWFHESFKICVSNPVLVCVTDRKLKWKLHPQGGIYHISPIVESRYIRTNRLIIVRTTPWIGDRIWTL